MKIQLREGVIHQVCSGLEVSRDGLARRMNVASTTAYRVEKGDVEPSPRFIASLMTLTGQPFEDLFLIVDDEIQVPA